MSAGIGNLVVLSYLHFSLNWIKRHAISNTLL